MVLRKTALLAVVCDGMGGMQGGARASRLAADIMKKRFLEEDTTDTRVFLLRSVHAMDQAICAMFENGVPLQAGTTIVAVILQGKKLHWLSVGDSRIYLYRAGKMLCPVPAHNYRLILHEQLESGEITQAQFFREEKQQNADGLISYLGIDGVPRAETNMHPFYTEPGDQILLCSDGLFKSLEDREIYRILENGMETADKSRILLQTALEKGGPFQDNVSLILIEIRK